MKVMLFVFAAGVLFEMITLLFGSGKIRTWVASLAVIVTAFASGGIVATKPAVWSVGLLLFSGYRVINMLRMVEHRMREEYLRHVAWRTSLCLLAAQAVLLVVGVVVHRHPIGLHGWTIILIILQTLTAVVLLASTFRHLRTTRMHPGINGNTADRDLPTVTIAIPARNEDDQLEACLQSILANDYPKLEVVVLDDSSQDNTSNIIRAFAHDGVRFVPGQELQPTWLAKNQAYEQLAKEASGDFILFCGVDVRFGPRSLRDIMLAMLQRRKQMVSFMPINELPAPSVTQSMRYVWELALPRRLFRRPPVLSSCWMIAKGQLTRLGGFAAVSRSITPEAYFARELIKQDGYSFLRSNLHLGLISLKSARRQRATAIRMRYPQLHRKPEVVALAALTELLLLLGPFVLFPVGFWLGFAWGLEVLLGLSVGLLLAMYGTITALAFPHNRWVVLPIFPFAVAFDVLLLHYSMWKYEFSEVLWKGRNVSVPVMHSALHGQGRR